MGKNFCSGQNRLDLIKQGFELVTGNLQGILIFGLLCCLLLLVLVFEGRFNTPLCW